jgi:hypothetical protein
MDQFCLRPRIYDTVVELLSSKEEDRSQWRYYIQEAKLLLTLFGDHRILKTRRGSNLGAYEPAKLRTTSR